LEINFETKELRDLCENEALASHSLGPAAAESLKHRLSDIRAADSMHDVPAGRPRMGKFQNMDCYRLELADGRSLVVLPNHAPPRNNAAGETDWGWVRRVKVVALEA